MQTITYAWDNDTGRVWSRFSPGHVDGKYQEDLVAVPVLQYNDMAPENNFQATYKLEKFRVHEALQGADLTWTKKIPVAVKNQHRSFWGLKPLPPAGLFTKEAKAKGHATRFGGKVKHIEYPGGRESGLWEVVGCKHPKRGH